MGFSPLPDLIEPLRFGGVGGRRKSAAMGGPHLNENGQQVDARAAAQMAPGGNDLGHDELVLHGEVSSAAG